MGMEMDMNMNMELRIPSRDEFISGAERIWAILDRASKFLVAMEVDGRVESGDGPLIARGEIELSISPANEAGAD